jgi:hypothetical protein
MLRCVDLLWTDVSEESIASIFRVEKSASKEPAWGGGCRLHSHRCENLKSYIESGLFGYTFVFRKAVTKTYNYIYGSISEEYFILK